MSDVGADGSLQSVLATGRAAWPTLLLDGDLFRSYVIERYPEASRSDLGDAPAADMYLACACQHRIPGALEAFEKHHLQRISAIVWRFDSSPAFEDEVRQLVRNTLFVEEDGPGKIAQYSGKGPLSAWVGITVQRIALRLRRRWGQGRTGDEALINAFDAAGDPALEYLRVRFRADLKTALGVSCAELSARDKVILRMSMLEGVSMVQIAAMYKVNQSTVSRWLQAARSLVLEKTRSDLRGRLRLSDSDLDSLIRLVQSRFDITFSNLLGPGPGA